MNNLPCVFSCVASVMCLWAGFCYLFVGQSKCCSELSRQSTLTRSEAWITKVAQSKQPHTQFSVSCFSFIIHLVCTLIQDYRTTFLFMCVVSGVEPSALHVLDKGSPCELHPSPF